MTHDDRQDIVAAWGRLIEISEDIDSYALRWVALTGQGVVADGERAGDVIEAVERRGYRADQVLFHFVDRVVPE